MPLLSKERYLLSITQSLFSILNWHLNNLFILSTHRNSRSWHRAILILLIYRGKGLRVLHIIRLIKERMTALSSMLLSAQVLSSYSTNSTCLLTDAILFLKVLIGFSLESWAVWRRIIIINIATSSTRWDFADWAMVSGRPVPIKQWFLLDCWKFVLHSGVIITRLYIMCNLLSHALNCQLVSIIDFLTCVTANLSDATW